MLKLITNLCLSRGPLHNRTARLLLFLTPLLTVIPAACRSHGATEETRFVPANDADDFHADNDIAMTIRSLADALKVGEPLDSSFYNFEGVLTDGQGTPLYTDIQGAPGVWEIDVINDRNVTIRNLYLGDLLPADLETYLLQSLSINDSQPFVTFESDTSSISDSGDIAENRLTVYDFGGGYLCFNIQSGLAPNGLEGPLLNILMTADLPDLSEDETQTTVSAQNVAKP